MANKDLNEIGLPKSITNIFITRNLMWGLQKLQLQLHKSVKLQTCTQNEYFFGHLPTCLKGLDEVLCDGIPFGVLTELVGPTRIGKTQIKNISGMIEIGLSSFPDIFHMEGMAQEVAVNQGFAPPAPSEVACH
ncbi:unnamed protein product [Camellia sinensis]